MSNMAANVNCIKIDGHFLPVRDKQLDECSDEDGNSDDEDIVDFSDTNIFSSDAAHVNSSHLKKMLVEFKEYSSGKVYPVEGSLHFYEPWWAATIQVRKTKYGGRYQLMGFPAYRPRTDPKVASDGVVLSFLAACKVHEQHIYIFHQFVRDRHLEHKLDFENFYELLVQFGSSSPENEEIMTNIKKFVDCTDGPGFCLFQSQGLQDVYGYLPQLIPRHFRKIVVQYTNKLPALQETLIQQPWVFGFAKILGEKHKLFGCEAQLQNFHNSGLMERIDPVIRDSLHIYDALKFLSRQGGHTYSNEKFLSICNRLKDYKMTDWSAALQFLIKNKVVVREEGNTSDSVRIFLTKFWKAEKNIANGVKLLFQRHEEDPWTFDLDMEEPRFGKVKSDMDQKKAATLISQQPIVVLSGKGGCGKTTVVSAVFKYAQELLKKEQHTRYQDQMFAEAEVDDFTLTQTVSDLEKTFYENQESRQDDFDGIIDKPGNPEADKESASNLGRERLAELMLENRQTIANHEPNPEADISSFWDMEDSKENPDDSPIILLTAPTGKAANHLGKSSGLPSFTLHQVIFSFWNWKRGDSGGKNNDGGEEKPWKFCKVQALVVDESSLVSVSTFNTMLSALVEYADLKKVVLLGDVNQLPSIEPGNFLSDLFASLHPHGCTVMLTQNHRSEARLIVENATKIAEQREPVINPDRHFYLVNLDELGRGVQENSAEDDLGMSQDQAIRQLLRSESPSLGGHTKSQFVAFRRHDCEAINEICSMHYAQHPTKNAKKKTQFQPGDKVCCSKNAQVTDELTKKKMRLCNGEIFFVKEDVSVTENKKTTRFLTMTDAAEDTPLEIKVNFKALQHACKLKHAWARTIHTYQGSESDTVVYVLGSPYGQTWQHVYTAVTRGKKQVFIVTRKSHLQKAILNKPKWRYTSLREKLAEALQHQNKGQGGKNGFIPASQLVSSAVSEKSNQSTIAANKSIGPTSSGCSKTTIPRISKENSMGRTFAESSKSTLVSGAPSVISHNTGTISTESSPNLADQTADSSQAFSDWGDEVVEDITEFEASLYPENTTPVIHRQDKDISKPHLHENEPSRRKLFVESVNDSGATYRQHSMNGDTKASLGHSRRSPNLYVKSLCSGLDESPPKPLIGPFETPPKRLGQSDGLPTKHVNSSSSGHQCSSFKPLIGPFQSPPKRHLETLMSSPSKIPRHFHGPVTDSDISPLRKDLVGVRLVEDSLANECDS